MPTLKYKRASLVAAMQGTQETWVQSLGQEGNGNSSVFLPEKPNNRNQKDLFRNALVQCLVLFCVPQQPVNIKKVLISKWK